MGKYRFEDLSEGDLRHLVQSLEDSDIPIFLVEPDNNNIIFANSAWTEHAQNLHDNFRKGIPLDEALLLETQALAPQLNVEAQKRVAKEFSDTIRLGGAYEFGGPDGKLYRGQYSKSSGNRTLGISFDVTEIKSQRAKTKRAQKSLETTLEGLHHGVMLYNKKGYVRYFNKSFLATANSLGIRLEKGMFHRDLRDQLPDDLFKTLSDDDREDLGDFEFVQQAPNGKVFLIESRRLSNETVLVSTVDVSELQEKRTEAKIMRETLERTLEGLAHGVMLIDETGHVAYCNESLRVYGSETGVNIRTGMHFSEIRASVPHKDPEGTTTPKGDFEYQIEGEGGKSFMVRRRTLDGIGILVSMVDVTELNQQRAEVRTTKEMLERSLESLPHGVLLYNEEGTVEYFNSQFRKSLEPLGVKVEKGMAYYEMTTLVPETFKNELRGKNPGEPFELIQTSFDGRSFLIEGHPIENVGFLVSTVEVTELQNALEAAKAADIAKTSFLANMSHEIRTPMNGVLGMAQVLEQTAINEHQQKCIDIIKSSSEMLLRIINDILDISKLDADKIEIELAPFNLESCVNQAIEIVKPNLKEKADLEIISEVAGKSAGVFLGDSGRIRQILINLLSNGIKFTKKGHVKITTNIIQSNERINHIHFRVEDTGIGISPEKYDKIFKRFEQSDNSTTREYGGTGLGLAISKRLANLMGGDLTVCTEYKGGACFEFSLPLELSESAPIAQKPISRIQRQLPVLIIDDNPVNHMVLSNQLKPLKVKPYCVTSAAQGLSIIKRTAAKNLKIPLVICDYKMPGQTGLDFVKSLKSDPAIADTPVIILSSADIMARKKDFVDLGVKVILEKPCLTSEIVEAVSEQLFRNMGPERIAAKPIAPSILPPNTDQIRRILVADDDPGNREVFKALLDLNGFETHIVTNGLQAVQNFSKHDYDLVLMDISMPVLGGIGATEKIRKYEKQQKRKPTPIIAVSAHALKGDREQFLSYGMNDYLPKPILNTDFEKILKKWLSNTPEAVALAS